MSINKEYLPSNEKIRKILFPIDGSESSKAVIEWGIRNLDHSETSIYLLIVIKSLDHDYSPTVTSQILEEAKCRFEERKFLVEKTDFVVSKSVASAICQYADTEGIAHIIMGSHGKTIGPIIFGSISRAVMEKARQPVVIIKNPHLPLLETANPNESVRTHERSVLVPVDNNDVAEKLIPLMSELFDKHSAVIHLLHVVVHDSHNAAHINNQFESGKKILEKNKETFETAGYWVAAAGYESGDPAEVIFKYAEKRGIDQISILSQHLSNIEKLLFGSISTVLVKQNKYKVLVFSCRKTKKDTKQPVH